MQFVLAWRVEGIHDMQFVLAWRVEGIHDMQFFLAWEGSPTLFIQQDDVFSFRNASPSLCMGSRQPYKMENFLN